MSRYIKSRKHAVAPLAALAASLTLPLAHAAEAPAPADAGSTAASSSAAPYLPQVKIEGTAQSAYKADKSASSKLTQPLLETPKTISVIKKEVLREQGAVSLIEALQNTPGITMQLGENGNTSAGDTFQMRGFLTRQYVHLIFPGLLWRSRRDGARLIYFALVASITILAFTVLGTLPS